MSAPPKPILASLTRPQVKQAAALIERYVDRSGGPGACWPWTGGSFVQGYAVVYTPGSAKTRRLVKVHRLVFELANDGLSPPTVDHMCHDSGICVLGVLCPHRRCCNPHHLANATLAENAARAKYGIHQEVCGNGHRMNPDNVYEAPDGGRHCRKCSAANARRARMQAQVRSKTPSLRTRPYGMPRAESVEWALDGQDPTQCMFWPGVTAGRGGYVNVSIEGQDVPAHHAVYTVKIGRIPPRYVIDHTCHDPDICSGGLDCPHRPCINPAHLQAVPNAVNTGAGRAARRKRDACDAGHTYTAASTYIDSTGSRHCRLCTARRARVAIETAKAAAGWVDARFRKGGVCSNGHDVSDTGLTADGKCRACRHATQRRYEERQRLARDAAALGRLMSAAPAGTTP